MKVFPSLLHLRLLVISFLADVGNVFFLYLGKDYYSLKVDEKCVVPKGDRHLLFMVQDVQPHIFTLKCLLNNYSGKILCQTLES